MKVKDLTTKSRAELESLLRELQGTLTQLRFDLADTKLKDVSQIGKVRRDIARVHTLLRVTSTP